MTDMYVVVPAWAQTQDAGREFHPTLYFNFEDAEDARGLNLPSNPRVYKLEPVLTTEEKLKAMERPTVQVPYIGGPLNGKVSEIDPIYHGQDVPYFNADNQVTGSYTIGREETSGMVGWLWYPYDRPKDDA